MPRLAIRTLIILALLSVACTFVSARDYDVTLRAGVIMPKGSLDRYADTGIVLGARLNAHLESFPAISLWGGFDWLGFNDYDNVITVHHSGYDTRERITTNERGYSFMVGAQLGSSSRRAFLRPRIGGGVGAVIFKTQQRLFETVALPDSSSNTTDMRIRPGALLTLGTDFFFSTKWGIGVELSYAGVLNLRHPSAIDGESSNVGFVGVTLNLIGAVSDEDL